MLRACMGSARLSDKARGALGLCRTSVILDTNGKLESLFLPR